MNITGLKKTKKNTDETPLMRQYFNIKSKYPDALLLFRVGDFYETFEEDARKMSKILGITLTKRANGSASSVDLAGFPYHALDTYLPRLVRAGMRVAICEQLEDPKLTKKVVKRGVTEVITPGISYNENILEHKQNNFLAALYIEKNKAGVSFLDASTGEFLVAEGDFNYIDSLLQKFNPNEVIFQKKDKNKFNDLFGTKFFTYTLDDWIFSYDFAEELLKKTFDTYSLKGFGIEKMNLAIVAAGAILHYLSGTHNEKISHINKITRIEQEHYVWLDKFTIRNLELVSTNNENASTLLEVMDQTVTPMGGRMLKRWILLPLKDIKPINERLEIVEFLLQNNELNNFLKEELSKIGDIERIISRVSVAKANPRDILQLKRALISISLIKNKLEKEKNEQLRKIATQINECKKLQEIINNTLKEDAPAIINKGGVIKEGVNTELDELRKLLYSGKEFLKKILEKEIKRTNITNLKIGFNNVFGYYLEVRKIHINKVPDDWIRKQTLTQAERYITDELKEYESKILGAEEKILILENKLFSDLILEVMEYIQAIQINANIIAKLDCLLSFSIISKENNYSKPKINDSKTLLIQKGRHPVIEKQLPLDEKYVPNDIFLDSDSQQIIIITGPNMSGKSALLRQTALIVLMAQMGCFVPAENSEIGIIDKIFTRVGASDNISSGESTFMVEMNETASILNNISEKSLILLDEIGRGTSTYDGISIAWSIVEYLHDYSNKRPKTLFATHYHELNELENKLSRVRNFNISVKESGNKVIFLRKFVPGGSEHSFGIHVAKMAGMPKIIVKRAEEILKILEKSHSAKKNDKKKIQDTYQLSFIQLNDPLIEKIKQELKNADIETMTPIEALIKLNEIKKIIEENE